MQTSAIPTACLWLWIAAGLQAEPIQVHPNNPHYFLYRGRPTILITSAEHYGAAVNRAFDYVAYLDALRWYGLNYTRIYPGSLFEPVNKLMAGNTLGVKPADLVVPWAHSSQPGYALGGNKFDLDRRDAEYFQRFRDFVAKAAERGVVVEVCFFNAQYDDTWPISPLYHKNNIQGVGDCHFNDAQTLRHPDLAQREVDYVRKLTQELNGFDNVILEICDEPILLGTPVAEAGKWIRHLAVVITATESRLPKRHMIAQQVEGPLGGPCDFSADPSIAVITTQYVFEASAQQLGGMQALDLKYQLDKPIELNETNYYPIWYAGDKVAASRVEAWEFIVGGGAGFNHLNGLYTVQDPAGSTPENARICTALKNLKEFMESLDFIQMHQDREFVGGGVPNGARCRGISQPGRQYALYLHHSTGEKGAAYKVSPGDYREQLQVRLARGTYRADFVDPASGAVLRTEQFEHAGGARTLATPAHSVDIALRIRAVASPKATEPPK